MIPEIAIQKIIEAAIQAPSGDNCQPWRFEVEKNTLNVFLIPERDNSLYSWGNRASLIAIGAAIENILIACPELGFKANITFFPNPELASLVASIELLEDRQITQALYQTIFTRSTNRKAYKNRMLTEHEKEALGESLTDILPVKILWEYDNRKRKHLGDAAAANEKILFGNFYMHKFFFEHINWTPEEEASKKMGFNPKTLELPPPIRPLFKFFKNWKFMLGLNKIGFPSLIAMGNGKLYASGAATGLIVIPDSSELSYVKAGIAMQKAWLTANSLGLQFQVLTGICLLVQKIFAGQISEFSPSQIEIIKSAYGQITKEFSLTDPEIGVLMFRLGEGEKPSSRTLRQHPEIKFIKQ